MGEPRSRGLLSRKVVKRNCDDGDVGDGRDDDPRSTPVTFGMGENSRDPNRPPLKDSRVDLHPPEVRRLPDPPSEMVLLVCSASRSKIQVAASHKCLGRGMGIHLQSGRRGC